MYTSTPGGTPAPLRLARVGRRAFDGASTLAGNAEHRRLLHEYLSDLVRPHGLALREDLLDAGAGGSYGEMAAELIADTVRADEPVDLLVLAMALPDVRPGRATAAYLSHACPGTPLAFCVCDQGSAGPFSALRVIADYGCARSLLLVVEQSTLHYDPVGPAPLPRRDTAVALLFEVAALSEESAPYEAAVLPVFQRAGVSPEERDAVLGKELAELRSGRPDLVAILGDGLDPEAALAGRPTTGTWWRFAGAVAGRSAAVAGRSAAVAGRRAVLADYDPLLRYVSVAAFDVAFEVDGG